MLVGVHCIIIVQFFSNNILIFLKSCFCKVVVGMQEVKATILVVTFVLDGLVIVEMEELVAVHGILSVILVETNI